MLKRQTRRSARISAGFWIPSSPSCRRTKRFAHSDDVDQPFRRDVDHRRSVVKISGISGAGDFRVAVGTIIADRPPHRSVRAALPHTAPTLDIWRRRFSERVPLPARRRTRMNPSDTEIPALRRVRVRLVAVLLGTRPSLVRLLHRYYVRGRIPTRPVHIRLRRKGTARRSQNGGLRSLKIGFSCIWFPPLMEGGGAGLFDSVGFRAASRLRPLRFCLPFQATRSASQIGFSELNPPAHLSAMGPAQRWP